MLGEDKSPRVMIKLESRIYHSRRNNIVEEDKSLRVMIEQNRWSDM